MNTISLTVLDLTLLFRKTVEAMSGACPTFDFSMLYKYIYNLDSTHLSMYKTCLFLVTMKPLCYLCIKLHIFDDLGPLNLC